MISYNDVTKGNINKHNLNWPQISDHPYRILTKGGSGTGNENLIKQQDDDVYSIIDKIHLYLKDLYEANYQYLIRKT